MWKALIVAVLASLSPVIVAAAAPAETVKLRRPTLIVADMDRALALYRDILGFQPAHAPRPPMGDDVYSIFNIDLSQPLLYVPLDTEDVAGALALISTASFEGANQGSGVRGAAIVLNADGRFDDILRRLKAGGYRLLPAHPLGEDGIEMGFFDADGHLLVLFETGRKTAAQ